MEWTPSPSGTVWRKRVHLVGAAEAGRYLRSARRAALDLSPARPPGRLGVLGLDGVVLREHGAGAGSQLLIPEGLRHPRCRATVGALREAAPVPGRTRGACAAYRIVAMGRRSGRRAVRRCTAGGVVDSMRPALGARGAAGPWPIPPAPSSSSSMAPSRMPTARSTRRLVAAAPAGAVLAPGRTQAACSISRRAVSPTARGLSHAAVPAPA